MAFHIAGGHIVDAEGRTVQFRGINLGGESKMPTRPCGYTWREMPDDFFQHRDLSFVNRPFPLADADKHFCRLRSWGYTLLRFTVTWEAIEHAGPGLYDTEYLDFLVDLLRKAGQHGFAVWIDPHQDVWSRFTGGSGAPGWTLEAVGFDLRALDVVGAAVTSQLQPGHLPHMVWPTNYTKLACATMFMLFFAGATLAPKTMVGGESAQAFLQRHFVNAMLQVVQRVKDLPCVIGYGVMNEPNKGWIGMADLSIYDWDLKLGPCCSPLHSLALGGGLPTSVPVYDHGAFGFKKVGNHVLNESKRRAWQAERPCVWEAPRHFCEPGGRPVEFYADFYIPFAKRFEAAVHALHPTALIFVESAPFAPLHAASRLVWPKDPERKENVVLADHWYDGIPLVTQKYRSWMAWDGQRIRLGVGCAQRARAKGIRDIQRAAAEDLGGAPVVVGETGVPFNLSGARAFRTGDFTEQIRALDGTMRAVEECAASCTLWNYCAENTNAHGDNWNGEDFSLFSLDQQRGTGDVNDGGRALPAAVRPYAQRFAGSAVAQAFDLASRRFCFRFRSDSDQLAPTELFLPALHYPNGCSYEVSDGRVEGDLCQQRLLWVHEPGVCEHTIHIWDKVAPRPSPCWPIRCCTSLSERQLGHGHCGSVRKQDDSPLASFIPKPQAHSSHLFTVASVPKSDAL